MYLNKKNKSKTIKYKKSKKIKNIRKSKRTKLNRKYKLKNKSKKRNYEEMYYQPIAIPLISFRSKSLKKSFKII